MPRYLIPNADGYCERPTATMPRHLAPPGAILYEGQELPCWPSGEPVTAAQLAAMADEREAVRLAGLAEPIGRILSALADSGIETPADWADAEVKLSALEDTQLATACALRILAARTELYELGGTWSDIAAFAARFGV